VKAVLARDPLDERRARNAVPERQSDFAAERQGILAAEIAVADIRVPIVGDIVFRVDVVEEPGANVEAR